MSPERLAALLDQHRYNGGGTCTCDGLAAEDIDGRAAHVASVARHRLHVAEVVMPAIRAALAREIESVYDDGQGCDEYCKVATHCVGIVRGTA